MKFQPIGPEEIIPSDFEEWEEFIIHWTGWRSYVSQIAVYGAWIAYDRKTNKGYYLTVPQGKFNNFLDIYACIDTSVYTPVSFDQHLILRDREYREEIKKVMYAGFKKELKIAERERLMEVLDGENKDGGGS